MQSWNEPKLPKLVGLTPVPRIFDSATQQVRELPGVNGHARMYVCGITPYDATHLGHAATYVAFDLLNRAWRNAGLEVKFVQNVTDVDDPLLERATATGVAWDDLAQAEIALFRTDMEALNVIPPHDYIGAVESIPLVIEMIRELMQLDAVYDLQGDLYFDVSRAPSFGAVSDMTRETMIHLFGQRGGDPERPGKRDPLDSLLWQAERPNEPSWESPFGKGRPGWHVECSAIARHYLGTAFDVQGGGSDLVFPHHEMSASEATALDGDSPFAKTYVHAGMVALDGEKMSKSKGNLVLVSKLRAQGEDPRAIRLALLAHHYRSDWEWFESDLSQARDRLSIWRQALAEPRAVAANVLVEQVGAALADDLNAPLALVMVDEWASETIAGKGESTDQDLVRDLIEATLGVPL